MILQEREYIFGCGGSAREHQHRSTDTPPRLDFSGSDVGATHEMGATHDEVCDEMTNTVDKREL